MAQDTSITFGEYYFFFGTESSETINTIQILTYIIEVRAKSNKDEAAGFTFNTFAL